MTRLDPVLFHLSYYFLGTETGELKVPMDHVQYISMNDVCVYIYTDLVHGVSSTGFCQRNCLLQLWLIPSSETEDRMMLYWVVSSEWWLLALSLYSPWFVLPDSHVSDGLTGDHLSPPPSYFLPALFQYQQPRPRCYMSTLSTFNKLEVIIFKSFNFLSKLNANVLPYLSPLIFLSFWHKGEVSLHFWMN